MGGCVQNNTDIFIKIKTSVSNDVSVPFQESERSCVCVLEVHVCPVYQIFDWILELFRPDDGICILFLFCFLFFVFVFVFVFLFVNF